MFIDRRICILGAALLPSFVAAFAQQASPADKPPSQSIRLDAVAPADISGNWVATAGNFAGRSQLWITSAGGGGWKAVVYYNPYFQIAPVTATSITVKGSDFKLSIDTLHLRYAGELSADTTSILGFVPAYSLNLHRLLVPQPITGDGLEQLLAAARGKRDATLANQLYGLKLNERLSAARLSQCEVNLPGPKSKRALMALADRSEFLDPPASEIPAIPTPELAAQNRMFALTADYVNKTIHNLPNLFATRVTTAFQRDLRLKQFLHPFGQYKATVTYRDGQEKERPSRFQDVVGMTTSGEFGPILAAALLDAAHGNPTWSHWEQGAAGPEAVFRYAITAERSHYLVKGKISGYEGEIAIDPSNGTILRLALKADLEPANPFLVADVVVEYGPVKLGGKTYICPLKGIAFSEGLYLNGRLQWTTLTQFLNDVAFEQYRLFRASARLLPSTNQVP